MLLPNLDSKRHTCESLCILQFLNNLTVSFGFLMLWLAGIVLCSLTEILANCFDAQIASPLPCKKLYFYFLLLINTKLSSNILLDK